MWHLIIIASFDTWKHHLKIHKDLFSKQKELQKHMSSTLSEYEEKARIAVSKLLNSEEQQGKEIEFDDHLTLYVVWATKQTSKYQQIIINLLQWNSEAEIGSPLSFFLGYGIEWININRKIFKMSNPHNLDMLL